MSHFGQNSLPPPRRRSKGISDALAKANKPKARSSERVNYGPGTKPPDPTRRRQGSDKTFVWLVLMMLLVALVVLAAAALFFGAPLLF